MIKLDKKTTVTFALNQGESEEQALNSVINYASTWLECFTIHTNIGVWQGEKETSYTIELLHNGLTDKQKQGIYELSRMVVKTFDQDAILVNDYLLEHGDFTPDNFRDILK